jgi:Putative transposase
MILQAEEFIRRFLLHVLPDGFQRIRYYGFLGNRYREQKLAHCRELLGMPTPEAPALETAKDYRERYEELTGSSLWQCPVCRQGRMLVTQILPRCPPRQVSLRIAHDEEDCHEIQSKSFRASLAGPSDRSGVGTWIIAKIFSGTDLIPRHHESSLEAARHTRSIPHAHHFRPFRSSSKIEPAIDTHSRRHTSTV